jgi:hypothetical protein
VFLFSFANLPNLFPEQDQACEPYRDFAVFPFLSLFILKTVKATLRNVVFVRLVVVVIVSNAILALTVAAGADEAKGKVQVSLYTP